VPLAAAAQEGDAALIENAVAAAPSAVSAEATVIHMDAEGEVHVLREGSNGWTCMPDNPASPGNDPMCLDKGGLAWAEAWIAHEDPDDSMVGFAYMLQGGSDASNTDPYGIEPPTGAGWVDTGPHVMIFNAGAAIANYPAQGDAPDTRAPYVMWAGTPYEHLMIPVE
jgi:hypothetical protein